MLVWDENRKKKSKRVIFLLNDALLIAKRDGARKYWLRVFISLSSPNVLVENMSSGFDCTSQRLKTQIKPGQNSTADFSPQSLSSPPNSA